MQVMPLRCSLYGLSAHDLLKTRQRPVWQIYALKRKDHACTSTLVHYSATHLLLVRAIDGGDEDL